MKKLLILAFVLVSSFSAFAQQNLKINWDDHKLVFSLPYPADNGYEIDEFGNFYVYSEEFPLVLSAITAINDTKLTPTNYKDVFAKSTNGKNIKGTLLDNGLYVVQFHWDDPNSPQCTFIQMINDKLYVTAEIKDDNGKYLDHFKKFSITKK